MGSRNEFVKLETNSVDEQGSIYVYINPDSIIALSRFRAATTVFLSNGNQYVVKESPSEIFEKIDELKNVYLSKILAEAFNG